jgi:MtrB/PioB family decaheme-associated outer membrane protein
MNGNDIRVTVRRGLPLLLAAAILSTPMRTDAEDAPAVDTSRWACKYCPFEEGLTGDVELGPGYVSDDSFKFGEYTGLNEQGGYIDGSATIRSRSHDGSWLDLSATNLGLDTRSLSVASGKQGSYRLSFGYKELPHNISGTALTPFLGVGTSSLTLPSGWVPGANTGTMPELAASLHGIDLETQRRAVDLGASLTSVVHWEFAVRFRHEDKLGTLGTAGSFVFGSSQLGMPVDYDTNQMDVSAAYSRSRLQVRLAYYGSIFKNNDVALTWANPYVPLVAGATAGQRALAPSNQFQQLVVSAGYEFGKSTHATADVALGRMTQDEPFLPYTTNSSLTTQPLPRSSLDGRVNTLTGNLKITSVVTDKLRFDAAFTYDDRDNQTPQAVYDWITTDVAPAAASPRTNLPYSSTHSVAKLDGGYALARDLRIDAGCDYDEYKRDLQEVDRTQEHICWGKATGRAFDRAEFMLKGSHAERTISNYTANPEIVSPENPLMRKYNMADRDRDTAALRVDVPIGERISVGLESNISWDHYRKSVIGLLDGRSAAVAADCAFSLSQDTSATCYLSHEQINSNQANAEFLPGAPLWYASNKDTIDTAGAGIKHRASDKLDIGLDYTYSRSTGEISIRGATVGFPDLTSRLDSAKLYATYLLKKRLSLRLAYWYENYRTEDWALDGVTPSTISNVLAFGQGNPSYHVYVITLSGRYQF